MTPAVPGLRGAGGPALAGLPRCCEQVFPARPEQVSAARRFVAGCLAGTPVADDAVLCVSELAGNCVSHSASGNPGGTFTVRVERYDGDYAWLEVCRSGRPVAPVRPGRPGARPGDRAAAGQ